MDLAKIHPDVTLNAVIAADHRRMTGLDDPGFCIVCGIEVDGVEPDTREAACERCEENGVFGASELVMMLVT